MYKWKHTSHVLLNGYTRWQNGASVKLNELLIKTQWPNIKATRRKEVKQTHVGEMGSTGLTRALVHMYVCGHSNWVNTRVCV